MITLMYGSFNFSVCQPFFYFFVKVKLSPVFGQYEGDSPTPSTNVFCPSPVIPERAQIALDHKRKNRLKV